MGPMGGMGGIGRMGRMGPDLSVPSVPPGPSVPPALLGRQVNEVVVPPAIDPDTHVVVALQRVHANSAWRDLHAFPNRRDVRIGHHRRDLTRQHLSTSQELDEDLAVGWLADCRLWLIAGQAYLIRAGCER